jgi:hypothetical protein
MNSQLHLDFPRFRMKPLRGSDTADSPDSLIFLASDNRTAPAARVLDKLGMTRL